MFAILLTLAVGGSLIAPLASANTVRIGDRRDPIGQHDIRRMVVDNTGDQVGATVYHRGRRWDGSVQMSFNVRGGPRAEYVAVVQHARPAKASFRLANGRPWRCGARWAFSRPDRRKTSVTGSRRCFAGATFVSVRVTVTSPKHKADSTASRRVPQQTRPNVVMIMVDDMRADDIRYMPWTRRLIGGRGVTFANSFAPHPLCCPARASILRGQYTHNHRVWTHKKPYAFPSLNDRSTLATWLRTDGYSTVFLGKYLNGYGSLPEPGATTGRSVSYVPPGWTDWRASIDGGLPASHPKNGGTYRFFDTTLSRNGRGFDNYAGRYQTRVYGKLSSQVIRARAASDRPFFFWASYTAPHHGTPREPDDPKVYDGAGNLVKRMVSTARPNDVKGKFDSVIRNAPGATWSPDAASDKPAYLQNDPLSESEKAALLEVTRQRAEALSVVDEQVKRTIDALAASGELEETMVVFTSDNGYYYGEHRIPVGKIYPYEEGIRVPLIMRVPEQYRGGGERIAEIGAPVGNIDLAPTLVEMARANACSGGGVCRVMD
ncbi:MAG: sulfatase-like hydrolase/transferase, partial [Pseudonocardia sp.]